MRFASAIRALGVDVVDRRERDVRRARRLLDPLAAAGEAVEHGDDAADRPALLPQRLDRGERRAAGRHDVLDDEAAVAVVEERALDAALEAVGLAPPCG